MRGNTINSIICILTNDPGPELSLPLLSRMVLCPGATQGFTGSDSVVDDTGDGTKA